MYLPKITEALIEQFAGEFIIEDVAEERSLADRCDWQWSQAAVAFMAMLQEQCDAAVAKELVRQNHRLAGYSERELAPFYQDELAG